MALLHASFHLQVALDVVEEGCTQQNVQGEQREQRQPLLFGHHPDCTIDKVQHIVSVCNTASFMLQTHNTNAEQMSG
jgi:hypothetical protein